MNHLAIYRKYRPSNFDEVSGQKVVVNILKNAIKNNNISHAYLFTGPRGTGKTSLAKIFAKTINCMDLQGTNYCNKCQSCINASSKECVDIIEIDAASNNGVDEIRELKSKINIVPSFLKYKVYIIDEVHMLSIGAFNALLKTLEEPPSHVIFILATTELHKVPSTILSRCQVLEFKKISQVDIKNRIIEICEKENVSFEETGIDEIVNFSDGCMRDALSLLEKINSYSNNNITLNDVRIVCGKPEKTHIVELIDLIKKNDLEKSLKKINDFYKSDYDMLYIVEDIINELDDIIFNKSNNDQVYSEMLSAFIEIFDNMKNSSVNKKIILEIGILNLLNKDVNKNISREIFYRTKIEQKQIKIENESDDTQNLKVRSRQEEIVKNIGDNEIKKFKNIRVNNAFVNANKEYLKKYKQKWEEIKKYAFDKEIGAKICLLLDSVPVVANEKYVVLLYQYNSSADKVNLEYIEIEKILNKIFSDESYIVAVDNDEWKLAKEQYINKINSGEKYQLLEDVFLAKILNDSDIINTSESNNVSDENHIEKKIYELFDSQYVEIK